MKKRTIAKKYDISVNYRSEIKIPINMDINKCSNEYIIDKITASISRKRKSKTAFKLLKEYFSGKPDAFSCDIEIRDIPLLAYRYPSFNTKNPAFKEVHIDYIMNIKFVDAGTAALAKIAFPQFFEKTGYTNNTFNPQYCYV